MCYLVVRLCALRPGPWLPDHPAFVAESARGGWLFKFSVVDGDITTIRSLLCNQTFLSG